MVKNFIKHLYYNVPATYPVIKSMVDAYYAIETKLIPDHKYYANSFKKVFGYELDLKNPKTFNEKINWLKLNQRTDVVTTCADKYAVRQYIENKLGTNKYLIPLVFHTTNHKDIAKENLPDFPVIIKANHYSSEVHIIRDKSKVDFAHIQFDCKRWLNHNFYYREREWQYLNIDRKILVEKLITDKEGKLPIDYKFHCFGGEVELIQLDVDREHNHKRNLYNTNFEYVDVEFKFPQGQDIYPKPKNFDKMKRIAKQLSKEFPYVRVDLYNVDGKIYFGELTFTPEAGLGKFADIEWDKKLGEKIKLNKLK